MKKSRHQKSTFKPYRSITYPVFTFQNANTPVGRVYTSNASGKPLLLPRRSAPAITGYERLNALRQDIARLRNSRRFEPTIFNPLQRGIAQRKIELRQLQRPVLLNSTSPCSRRNTRRQVMFAHHVAGRSWGSGGPKMQNARRTIASSYTCKR